LPGGSRGLGDVYKRQGQTNRLVGKVRSSNTRKVL
jgi:hypothetical protein